VNAIRIVSLQPPPCRQQPQRWLSSSKRAGRFRKRVTFGGTKFTRTTEAMMKNRIWFLHWIVVLACLAPALSNAQVTEVPIQEFISAQGQSGSSFFPPIPDHLGWAQALCTSGGLSCLSPHFDATRFCLGDFALVDYAALAEKYLVGNYGPAASSGTVVDGKVLKRPIAGGKVEITVSLQTKNALTFVIAPSPAPPGQQDACGNWLDFAGGPLLLGHRNNELPPPPLSERALGDVFFHVSFVNGALDPIPDLLILFYTRYADIREYSFHATATGPLRAAYGVPEGTPGRVTIVQAGAASRSNIMPAIVNLRETGK